MAHLIDVLEAEADLVGGAAAAKATKPALARGTPSVALSEAPWRPVKAARGSVPIKAARWRPAWHIASDLTDKKRNTGRLVLSAI